MRKAGFSESEHRGDSATVLATAGKTPLGSTFGCLAGTRFKRSSDRLIAPRVVHLAADAGCVLYGVHRARRHDEATRCVVSRR